MKLYDRVYDEPGVLGTVVATSADDADVYEGETVDVRWDATGETETRAVETLDRDDAQTEVWAVETERRAIEKMIGILDDQIQPLQEQRRALLGDLKSANELLAEMAVTDAEIVGARHTETGSARFTKLVSALHPAFYGTNELAPDDDPSTTYADCLPIPYLTLKYGDDAEYTESLADALVQYAERFLPDLPENLRTAIPASTLDHNCGDQYSWQIQYDPQTRTAILVDKYRYRYTNTPQFTGTLVEVINLARQLAWYTGGPNTDD